MIARRCVHYARFACSGRHDGEKIVNKKNEMLCISFFLFTNVCVWARHASPIQILFKSAATSAEWCRWRRRIRMIFNFNKRGLNRIVKFFCHHFNILGKILFIVQFGAFAPSRTNHIFKRIVYVRCYGKSMVSS